MQQSGSMQSVSPSDRRRAMINALRDAKKKEEALNNLFLSLRKV